MKTNFVVALLAILGVSEIQSLQLKTLVQKPSRISTLAETDQFENKFSNFISKYQRNYRNKDEYEKRKKAFQDNLDQINELNKENDGTLELGITKFSDLSPEEFKTLTGLVPQDEDYNEEPTATNTTSDAEVLAQLPSEVDWSDTGAVGKVVNQYSCGSCYAFATLGAIEGLHWIKNGGTKLDLSEQQIVDCTGSMGNSYCNGGSMTTVYKYAQDKKLMKESDYPYIKKATGSCKYSSSKGVLRISGYTKPEKSVNALMAAVAQQPVSVGISASKSVMQNYVGGVIKGSSCGTTIDHGVLLVGYGSTGSTNYWIVKNTWGTGWGEAGYVRIDRSTSASSSGVCGILKMMSYPNM